MHKGIITEKEKILEFSLILILVENGIKHHNPNHLIFPLAEFTYHAWH